MKRVSKCFLTDFEKLLDNMYVFYDELGSFVSRLKFIVDSLNGMMFGIGACVVEALGVQLAKLSKRDFRLLLKHRKYLKLFPEPEAPAATAPPAERPAQTTAALAVVPDAAASTAEGTTDTAGAAAGA